MIFCWLLVQKTRILLRKGPVAPTSIFGYHYM